METRNWHDRNYKKLLLIPMIILIISVGYLAYFNSQNGDLFYKDISLTGGTSITIFESVNIQDLELVLSESLPDLTIRSTYNVFTGEQIGIVIETTAESESAKDIIEEFLGIELVDGDNASIISTGSSFSEGFQRQLMIAILVAFIFMAIVIFIIFRTFIPSAAVVISAFANIVMTLVVFNLLGIQLSTAGIVALLMLIGYSVDTDVLLTTRMLKRREGTLNERIMGSIKTGMTMTLTSIFALLGALLIIKSFSSEIAQIFTILVIGLSFDLLNTWIGNVSILKWYMERKKWN